MPESPFFQNVISQFSKAITKCLNFLHLWRIFEMFKYLFLWWKEKENKLPKKYCSFFSKCIFSKRLILFPLYFLFHHRQELILNGSPHKIHMRKTMELSLMDINCTSKTIRSWDLAQLDERMMKQMEGSTVIDWYHVKKHYNFRYKYTKLYIGKEGNINITN